MLYDCSIVSIWLIKLTLLHFFWFDCLLACIILQNNLSWKLETGNGSFSVIEIGSILTVEGLVEQLDMATGKLLEKIEMWYTILGQLEWKRHLFSILAELLVVSELIGLCMSTPWMKMSLRHAVMLRYYLQLTILI